jgi:uncharacterized protein (TIRG00374 family)
MSKAPLKRFVGPAVGMLISVALILYLLKHVDAKGFVTLFDEASPIHLLCAFVIYVLVNVVRALRFRVLLSQPGLPLKFLFPITLYHNFLVRTLPFRTGEISYVALLRRYYKISITKSLSSLLGARLFELILIIMGGLIGLLTVQRDVIQTNATTTFIIAGCLVSTLAATYYSGSICQLVKSLLSRFVLSLPVRLAVPLSRLIPKLDKAGRQFSQIRLTKNLLQLLGFSSITYGSSVAFNLLLLRAIGVDGNLSALLIAISVTFLAASFPLTLSGFGVIEGAWTYGLVTFAHMDITQAVSIGFFLHGCQVLATALSGLLGFVLLQTLHHPSMVSQTEQNLKLQLHTTNTSLR